MSVRWFTENIRSYQKYEYSWQSQVFAAKCFGSCIKSRDQGVKVPRISCCVHDYILITNLMHWLLFIHKILFSSTCFEPQVLIFRRIQLYTYSIWYCHHLRKFVVACRYTAWVRTDCREKVVGGCLKTPTDNLKTKTWGSKHVEENSILWINNNQCIKLVINI